MAGEQNVGGKSETQAANVQLSNTLGQLETTNTALSQTLERMELQKAEDLFQRDEAPAAIAHLTRTLRRNPGNSIAAQRLISALTMRSFAPLSPAPFHGIPADSMIDFSRDGRIALVASNDIVQWRDMVSDRTLQETQLGSRKPLINISLSDNGRAMMVSGQIEPQVWHLSGERIALALPNQASVRQHQLSPDGQLAATYSFDHRVRVWSCESGRMLSESAPFPPLWDFVRLEFSPDSGLLITMPLVLPQAEIWDVHRGQQVTNLIPKLPWLPVAIHFSADGQRVGAACANEMRVWDVRSREALFPPFVHEAPVTDFRFSPDGLRLVTWSGYAFSARVWDLQAGRPVHAPLKHDSPVVTASFTPDGLRLITVDANGSVRLWDAQTQLPLMERFHGAGVPNAVKAAPDGARLLVSTLPWTRELWDIRPGGATPGLSPSRDSRPVDALSPRGDKALTWSGGGTGIVWSPDTLQALYQIAAPSPAGSMQVPHASFSAEGSRLLVLGESNALIFNAANGQLVKRLPALRGVYGPRSKMLKEGLELISFTGKSLQFWNLDDGRLIRTLKSPAGTDFGELLQFSPDGNHVATRNRTTKQFDEVILWDARTGNAVRHLRPAYRNGERYVGSAAFSGDGVRLSILAGNDASVWNLSTGRELFAPLEHDAPLHGTEFSRDSRLVLTVADKMVRVSEASTGRRVSDAAHLDRVQIARFSPDGRRFATTTMNGASRIWDTMTGHAVSEPFENFWNFCSDGQRVITCSQKQSPRVLEAPEPPLPVPAWFPELAESIGGKRISSAGTLEQVARKTKSGLALPRAAGTADFYERWVQWFLADRSERNISPSGLMSVGEHVQRCLEQNTPVEIADVIRFVPTNANALLRSAELLRYKGDLEPAVWLRSRAVQLRIPGRDLNASPALLDLSHYFNATLDEGWHLGEGDLRAMPRSVQTFAGVQFDVRGLIQLDATNRQFLPYPREVKNIAVNRLCARLHFLHSAITGRNARPGEEMGHYLIHYQNGETNRVPIVAGKDAADWRSASDEMLRETVIVWAVANRNTARTGRRTCVFKTSWPNPLPHVPISAIDFVTGAASAKPFLLAITLD